MSVEVSRTYLLDGATGQMVDAELRKAELTIHRAIRKLRESGRLERIGPDKGGH